MEEYAVFGINKRKAEELRQDPRYRSTVQTPFFLWTGNIVDLLPERLREFNPSPKNSNLLEVKEHNIEHLAMLFPLLCFGMSHRRSKITLQ